MELDVKDLKPGQIVRVKDGIREEECPVTHAVAGCTGVIESVEPVEDGAVVVLLWFGYRIPRLRSDGAYVYAEWLEAGC